MATFQLASPISYAPVTGSRRVSQPTRLATMAAVLLACLSALVIPAHAGPTPPPVYFAGSQSWVNFGETLDWPGGVAVDAQNNVYICDEYDNRVLKVGMTANGWQVLATITDTVGGAVFEPYAAVLDSSGNVFMAGAYFTNGHATSSAVIEESPQGGGTFQKSATIGSGMFGPDHIAIDGAGNLYVDDSGNNRFVLETNNGSGSYSQYVLDFPGIAHSGPIAVDPSGNVFVTDGWTWNITKLVPNGTPQQKGTDLAYTPYLLWSGQEPTALALDSQGDLYFGTYYYTNQILYELTPTAPGANTYNSASLPGEGLVDSGGMAVDSHNNVFFDSFFGALYEYSPATANFGSVPANAGYSAGMTLFLGFNSSVTLGSDTISAEGYPVNLSSGFPTSLDFSDAGTGTCDQYFPQGFSANEYCSIDLDFSPYYPGARYGSIEFFDSNSNPVATLDFEGLGSGPFITTPPGQQYTPISGVKSLGGLAIDENQTLYYTDPLDDSTFSAQGFLSAWSPNTIANSSSNLGQQNGVAVDGNADIFVTSALTGSVVEFIRIPSGYQQVTAASGFNTPMSVAVDGYGNLYVADTGTQAVYEEAVTPSGYVQSQISGGWSTPNAVAVDYVGDVFVLDTEKQVVLEETPALTGYVESTVANAANNGLSHPGGIAVDSIGNVYIADTGNSRVVKEARSSGGWTQKVLPFTGLVSPSVVAVDQTQNVYVGDTATGNIYELNLYLGKVLNFAATPVGQKSSDSPRSVTIVNSGNAPLTIGPRSGGANPLVPAGFELDPATTCPVFTSNAGTPVTIAVGGSCAYAVDFVPTTSGSTFLDLDLWNAQLPTGEIPVVGLSGTGQGPAALTSPAANSVLPGSHVTFTWTAGTGATSYTLRLGTTPGAYDIRTTGTTTATSATFSGLPLNGETIYARLYTFSPSGTKYADYVFTAATQSALSSPTPGSVLIGPKVTFNWGATAGATGYILRLGTTVGAYDIHTTGTTTETTVTFSGLPIDGETIYARLVTIYPTSSAYTDYVFTAATQAALSSPTPGSALIGPNVTFNWSAAAGATGYILRLGTTAGAYDIRTSGPITATHVAFSGLPTNGETIHARLYTVYPNSSPYIDYVFTAAP